MQKTIQVSTNFFTFTTGNLKGKPALLSLVIDAISMLLRLSMIILIFAVLFETLSIA